MNVTTERVALCMPVWDQVFPKAWMAHLQLMAELARTIPKDNLGLFYSHGLTQPHAQNFLVQSVLSNSQSYGVVAHPIPGGPADWILWVEHDTTPPPDAFHLLRAHADATKRPVMHGVSFDKKYPFAPSIWEAHKSGQGIRPMYDWEPNTLYRVAHSGTCISLFHTSVFDKLKRPWYRMKPFEPDGAGMIPCISLTKRMHEAGVPIFAYTGCVAGHIGERQEITEQVSRETVRRHRCDTSTS